jgi:hypothetical protein
MKLVEVVRTEYTDAAAFDDVIEWVGRIGKVGVKCSDTPGFIVNRLLVPSLMQAMSLVERVCSSWKVRAECIIFGYDPSHGPPPPPPYIIKAVDIFVLIRLVTRTSSHVLASSKMK